MNLDTRQLRAGTSGKTPVNQFQRTEKMDTPSAGTIAEFKTEIREAFEFHHLHMRGHLNTLHPAKVWGMLTEHLYMGLPATFELDLCKVRPQRALQAIDAAYQLGVGVLMAEFSARRSCQSLGHWHVPLHASWRVGEPTTEYHAKALKAIAYLARNWRNGFSADLAQPLTVARDALTHVVSRTTRELLGRHLRIVDLLETIEPVTKPAIPPANALSATNAELDRLFMTMD